MYIYIYICTYTYINTSIQNIYIYTYKIINYKGTYIYIYKNIHVETSLESIRPKDESTPMKFRCISHAVWRDIASPMHICNFRPKSDRDH